MHRNSVRLISESQAVEIRSRLSQRFSTRISESLLPFLNDIDDFIHGEEDEAEIDAIDEVFVPPTQTDETLLSEEELQFERRRAKIQFGLGCLMAFTSGLTITVNNFIVKATAIDFGVIMAVRGLMQIPVMFTIIALQGYIKKIIPSTTYLTCLTLMVGCFGACIMLSTFACVKFMPVGDAMTLIFTNPLFTMFLAAIFLGHKLTIIKNISAIILMAGIILVTKPPFLFPTPTDNPKNATKFENFFNDYLNRPYELYNIHTNVTQNNTEDSPGKGDLYFVGAIIALSSAILSAANNIVVAKIGDKVPVTVQLFYIGIGGFLISILCQLVDEDDKFFTPEISEIPLQDIGVALGVGIVGLFGFFCTTRSLTMIPPSTVATLRTSQIFIAFLAQVLIMQVMPAALDIIGAVAVFVSALAITFEKQVYRLFCSRCRCRRQGTTE